MAKKLKQFVLNRVTALDIKDGLLVKPVLSILSDKTHVITGNSTLVEAASSGLHAYDWNFEINGVKKHVTRHLRLANSLFVVDFKIENGESHVQTADIILNGFTYSYVDAETGEVTEGHATLLSLSGAQTRTLRAVFAGSIEARDAIIRKMGASPYLFAKQMGNGIWKMDADKWAKRLGLMQTTSHRTSLEFGNRIIDLGNNEFKIVGRDKLTIYVVNDCVSIVNKGEYRVFNPDSKKLDTVDASIKPYHRKVGDGMALISSRFADLCEAEGFTRNHQARLNPANKFMAIEYDAIKEVWPDADLVMSKSCVKGILDQFLKKHPKARLQYRIANKTQPAQEYRNMVYQFVNSMLITPHQLMEAFAESLDAASLALTDQTTMLKLIGVYLDDLDLESNESGEDEDEGDLTTRSMATELQEILTLKPEAFSEIYVVEKAHALLMKITQKWVGGTAPVRAQYKFLIDDPIAIVEAYLENVRDKNGNFIVPVSAGLAYGQCVYQNTFGKIETKEVAIGRAPCVTYGEVQVLEGSDDPRYQGMGWEGLLILNVKDLALPAMGGADCDGDIGMVMENSDLVNAAKLTQKRTPIIDEGCPFQDIVSKFDFQFTDDEWNDDFTVIIERMYSQIREYVAKALKANEIGLLSNRGSMFLNGVSDHSFRMTKMDASDREPVRKKNRDWLDKADLLRLCTGWEIDSVKHGGAFWNSLQHELAFVHDANKAPYELTEPHSTPHLREKGKRQYKKPAWFTYTQLLKANVAHEYDMSKTFVSESTLDQVHVYLHDWQRGFAEDVKAKLDEMRGQTVIPNTLMSDFTSAIGNVQDFEFLKKNFKIASREVMNHIAKWSKERTNLTSQIASECDKIIKLEDIVAYDHDTVRLLKLRNNLRAELAKNYDLVDEFYAGRANGLQKQLSLSDESFAYVAYMEAYRNYRYERINRDGEMTKGAKHYKYPWIVLGDKMLKLLALTKNRKLVHVEAKSDRVIETIRVIMPRNRMLDANAPIKIKRGKGGFIVEQYGKDQGDLVIYHMPIMMGIDVLHIEHPIRVNLIDKVSKSEMITYEVIFER